MYLKIGCFFTLPLCLLAASQPWKQASTAWTAQDADRILNDSPWSQITPAIFALAAEEAPPGPQIDVPQGAGMPNPKTSATDGRWDGGVGRPSRNGPPTLNVVVRWNSALPVREALARQQAPLPYSAGQLQNHYVLAVLGLVPAGRYDAPRLNAGSSSNTTPDVRNPEQMLENVMHYSRLSARDGAVLIAEDAKLDSSTGTLYLFFKRSDAIGPKTKEVLFFTRFGSLSIAKKFRLKDMLYQGKLEL